MYFFATIAIGILHEMTYRNFFRNLVCLHIINLLGFITFLYNGIAIMLLNAARKNTQNQKNHNGTHEILSQRDRQTDQENDEATYDIKYLYKLPDGRQTDRKKHIRAGTQKQ